jgi:hypothetical protein
MIVCTQPDGAIVGPRVFCREIGCLPARRTQRCVPP